MKRIFIVIFVLLFFTIPSYAYYQKIFNGYGEQVGYVITHGTERSWYGMDDREVSTIQELLVNYSEFKKNHVVTGNARVVPLPVCAPEYCATNLYYIQRGQYFDIWY